ncbi:MAG: sialidase family protein [Clostridiales bacterium]|nr:sialidase family protein [Clostridiales bacterium]
MKKAKFVMEPKILIHHTKDRSLIGGATIEIRENEIWYIPTWGGRPVNFNPEGEAVFSDPKTGNALTVVKSFDGGFTWGEHEYLPASWDVDGVRNGGGLSILRLHSRKLIMIAHRCSKKLWASGDHGIPAISFSSDEGVTWTPLRVMHHEENEIYVMNQRLIQLESGRLILPVAIRGVDVTHEEYQESISPNAARCYISDDEGISWRLSDVVTQDTLRGADEPCVAEIGKNKVMMLFRGGKGSHQICYSEDGGESWSKPQSTTLIAACSPLTLTTLPDGRLFIVYNHGEPSHKEAYYPRNPICYATSTNEGKTWSEPVLIEDIPYRQLIYPSIIPLKSAILVTYSEHLDEIGWKLLLDEANISNTQYGGKTCLVEYPD